MKLFVYRCIVVIISNVWTKRRMSVQPYCKNEKPFTYSVFSSHDKGRAISILEKIEKEGILFWFSEQFSKKEIKRIEAAYSCIIFLSRHAIHDEKVRRCIEYAVKFNKKILCIYLEPTPLTSGLELLLNSLQSIGKDAFADEQTFLEKLKSADVFSKMQITSAQKRFAKRRALASVFIPIASAVIIFFAVVVPLLIAPMVLAANGSLSKLGFGNLSLAELAKVKELKVVGTQSIEEEYYASYIDETKEVVVGHLGMKPVGNISDISDLALLKNVRCIAFEANQVTDISPLYKIKTLDCLTLNCNPIKSIKGIEALQNLREVNLAYTEISDISPLFQIPSLEQVVIRNTYANSIEGIENLEHLFYLSIGQSHITDISPLNKIDFSYINDSDGFMFEAENLHINDFSPLQRIPKFQDIGVTARRLDDILPYISNKQIDYLCIMESDIKTIRSLSSIKDIHDLTLISSYQLTSIDGIEEHADLVNIRMVHCPNITDYTPLLELPNLERLTMTSNMKERASIQLAGANFEIVYEDEET